MLANRFEHGVRWTSVLQQRLGNDYYVIEGGLNGRNTSFDETRFTRPSRNGLATLPLILEMNYPLDLVIFMLGTNDSMIDFRADPIQTVQAMRALIRMVKESHFGSNYHAPQVLLMAPKPIQKVDSADFGLFFDDTSIAKTHKYPGLYAELAGSERCPFLDIGPLVKISSVDGVHIERESQAPLAHAISKKIETLFS
jgi:lysophospholipase L1-like esterase